ncbi:glycosyltransferase [Aestuariicella hydrocarbonica]|uniref:Glycosyltransferase n=1 Tax=Pseudomaricurvus hydrocarbonicus TaxID=1470433 RepID=A0A9E5JTF1_9GAMM|nr:MJ1255/VC2487 family glycosyltransferase [Aestuariicella hydrocarbonica]NHO65248.1 glycosyltransferase [Aestuariicella hydrocarbonica]
MKLFYGVQGTGNGHISRARAMAKHLRASHVDVDYLFSGRPRADYFDMNIFGDWQCLDGLSFATHQGKIRPIETARRNNFLQLFRDIRQLDLSAYDLVICDFEPVTAWAAKLQGRPCITLGHQYAFQHAVPVAGASWLSKAIIKHFAPGQQQLGLHWHHFDQPILPPIVDLPVENSDRPDAGFNGAVVTQEPEQPSHGQRPQSILVYLGFEAPAQVIPLLQKMTHAHFVYYGEFSAASEQGNVSLRPLSVTGFKRDLHQSSGVICNAGFELTSEALSLGKRVLVKPLQGQMEQLSNALALETLELGSSMEQLSEIKIREWLNSPAKPACRYPDVAKAIVEWLTTPQREPIESLSQRLWSQSSVTGHHQVGPENVSMESEIKLGATPGNGLTPHSC